MPEATARPPSGSTAGSRRHGCGAAPGRARNRPRGRPRGRPQGAPASEDAILDAARSLFLEAGYDGVNLERIAAAAGLSRQTLYNRFGSKEAIFRAMLARHWALLTEGPFVRSPLETVGDRPPEAVLTDLSRTILDFIEERRQVDFTRLVIAESRRLPWIAEEFYRLGKAPLMQAMAACLAEMHRRGQIDCRDPAFAAHQFLGLVQEFVFWPRVMATGAGTAGPPAADRVIAESVRMFLCRYGRQSRDDPGSGPA